MKVFEVAARERSDPTKTPPPDGDGGDAPIKKRKKEGAGQPYRDTIGVANVGKKGGDQRGGVTLKTVDLCNYICAQGGWETVRALLTVRVALTQR